MINFINIIINNFENILLILLFIFIICLILKFIFPKRPILGIALATGAGIFGYLFLRHRWKTSSKIQEKIDQFNDSMAEFKEEQQRKIQIVKENEEKI